MAARSNRLLVVHFTAPPRIGGLEIAAWELAAAACRAKGWEALLITGTQAPANPNLDEPPRVVIPELSTGYELNREIFKDFRIAVKHPGTESVAATIREKLNAIISQGDLVVSFNCFSLPYNIALTSALWQITSSRSDFYHLTWSWDLCTSEKEYNWERKEEWPWRLMWSLCPGLKYAACTRAVAATQADAIGVGRPTIEVIPGGINPYRALRLNATISKVFERRKLLQAYPLIFMPAKISKRKDIPKAIRVLRALRARFPLAHLIIAGSPSPHDASVSLISADLRRDINRLGLTGAVTVLAWEEEFDQNIQFEDSMSVTAMADALLFTSTNEGFLFPILEAGLHNIPIFIPSHDSLLSWASSYAHVYEKSASPDAISESIFKVFHDQNQNRKFQFRTQFVWDDIFYRHFAARMLQQ